MVDQGRVACLFIEDPCPVSLYCCHKAFRAALGMEPLKEMPAPVKVATE